MLYILITKIALSTNKLLRKHDYFFGYRAFFAKINILASGKTN